MTALCYDVCWEHGLFPATFAAGQPCGRYSARINVDELSWVEVHWQVFPKEKLVQRSWFCFWPRSPVKARPILSGSSYPHPHFMTFTTQFRTALLGEDIGLTWEG